MLEVSDLSKRYGKVVALDCATFTVAPGRVTGFLGPNGAGKTTTMRAIFGLITPDSGTVAWEGSPAGEEARIRFGYMPEERGLYPRMEVDRQLEYFARLHGMERQAAAESVAGWLDRLGLSERSGEKVEALSHGNQQRVQLAAALVHNPSLVVLDEPFSGLDPLAVKTMSIVLRELAAAGSAVLLSSHQLELVEDVCEDVVIVNRGRVAARGTVQDLQDSHPCRVLEIGLESSRGWRPETDSISLLESRNGWARYSIPRDLDPAALLESASQAGRVDHFFFGAPSLNEIFAEAMADPEADGAEGGR